MKFVEIDNCPVPGFLGRRVGKLKEKVPSAVLNSCYRGSDPKGAAILRKNGKKTQQELYDGWVQRLPGFNPANPPGRSTHECRSDGAAYLGPLGRVLTSWQCGMDWTTSSVDELIAAGNGFAWALWRPYASGSEAHHLNFRLKPPWRWGKKHPPPGNPVLRKDSRRHRAVKRLQRSLLHLGYTIEVDGHFGNETLEAVIEFQRDNQLETDGIVGPLTWEALLR